MRKKLGWMLVAFLTLMLSQTAGALAPEKGHQKEIQRLNQESTDISKTLGHDRRYKGGGQELPSLDTDDDDSFKIEMVAVAKASRSR